MCIRERDLLGLDTQSLIDAWVDAHLRFMNRLGFWGNEVRMTHLQFQNGYHQHEVLEHLGVDNPRREQTLAAVRDLADSEGHFAPYPGGGGCYDYDAVFMLTPEGRVPNDATRALLLRTAASIIAEQQPDGGFAESLRVRPRSLTNLHMSVTVSYTHLDVYKRQLVGVGIGLLWRLSAAYSESVGKSRVAYNQMINHLIAESVTGVRQLKVFSAESRAWKEMDGYVRGLMPVSYTHLDVYKRQPFLRLDYLTEACFYFRFLEQEMDVICAIEGDDA